jgi:O-antigen ligase
LLYVLPMLMALTATRLFGRWFHSPVAESDASPASKRSYPWLSTILVVCTGIVGMTMLFTQSRSGLFGLLCGVLIMGLMSWPTGRRILVAGAILLVLGLPFFPAAMVEVISDAPQSVTLGDTSTLGFRQDVWQQALTAIHDFAYTGVGFGAFRKIMWLFYPIEVEYTDDIGHAHNFFMQTALDFGLIGMTALIAMWLVIFAQIVLLWSRNKALAFATWPWNTRVLAVSFLGSLIAQLVYSQLDAVAMGAKTNFFFWYLFALILGTANLAVSELHQPQAVEVAHPIDKNAGATSGAQSLGDLHSEPESAGAARQAA